MIEVDAALQIILSESKANIEREEIDFEEALNRVLAEDVYATEPVPPFRASIKDGYAVKASDGIGDRTVRHVAAAGDTVRSEICVQISNMLCILCFSLS